MNTQSKYYFFPYSLKYQQLFTIETTNTKNSDLLTQ